MPNNDNKTNSSLPDGLKSIIDDEAITEINLTDFLEESSQEAAPLYDGFHEDIEADGKNLEDDFQKLYDEILGSGPDTVVPKPISVLTATEAEPQKVALSDPDIPAEDEASSLDDLWMNPEDYFDEEIPVVSLDEGVNTYEETENPDMEISVEEIAEEAVFTPEPLPEAFAALDDESELDGAKSDIFNMIDMLKSDSAGEAGFKDILTEINENQTVSAQNIEMTSADQLVTDPAVFHADEEIIDLSDYDEPLPERDDEKPIEIVMPEEKKLMSDDEDFQRELAVLLGDAPEEETVEIEDIPVEEAPSQGFVIDIPDDGNDYDAAAAQPEKLYEPTHMSSIHYISQEDFEKEQKESFEKEKAEKKGKKAKKEKAEEEKAGGAGEVIRKIVLALSVITIVVSIGILANTYLIQPMLFKKSSDELVNQMSENIDKHDQTAVVDTMLEKEFPGVDFPDGMLAKYAQLYAANNDLRGWISIPGLEINLPITQGTDNDYYLKKDVYGKYTDYGVPFFDYRMNNFKDLHMNNVIYGHNMRSDDLIFGMLENYRTIDGFAQAPVIECNTIYGDHTWFVYAVFITNSKDKHDNGYTLPYNFVDISPAKFREYIDEIDKRKLYDTGIDINSSDKLLTLSTCCYDFDDARLVVVARLKREGESINVDTSKATENPNPKYPQVWYNINKKTNPYAEDTRWNA